MTETAAVVVRPSGRIDHSTTLAAVLAIRLDEGLTAVTLPGCHDMSRYSVLAQELGDTYGAAAFLLCLPDEPYQLCAVYRRGHDPHTFTPSERPHETNEHFAGLRQSVVRSPGLEGFALAGLGGRNTLREVCVRIGGHDHEPSGV